MLAEVAQEIDLGAHLLLGKGEDARRRARKQSILADAFEAVDRAPSTSTAISATHARSRAALPAGAHRARPSPVRAAATTRPACRSSPRRGRSAGPATSVRDEGPDHAKHFFAAVFVGDECYGEGEGGSKKQAEQARGLDGVERACKR